MRVLDGVVYPTVKQLQKEGREKVTPEALSSAEFRMCVLHQ